MESGEKLRSCPIRWSPSYSSCTRAADLDPAPLLSSVLVLLNHLPGQSDGVQVGVKRLRLFGAASLNLRLSQRVDHGHVDVQVVCLLETFAAQQTRKLQVGLRLVFGHVVFQRRALAALETTHLTLQWFGP